MDLDKIAVNMKKYNTEINKNFKKILDLKKDYQLQFKNSIIKIFQLSII